MWEDQTLKSILNLKLTKLEELRFSLFYGQEAHNTTLDWMERPVMTVCFMVVIMVMMVMGNDDDNDAAEGDGNVDNTVDDNTS